MILQNMGVMLDHDPVEISPDRMANEMGDHNRVIHHVHHPTIVPNNKLSVMLGYY